MREGLESRGYLGSAPQLVRGLGPGVSGFCHFMYNFNQLQRYIQLAGFFELLRKLVQLAAPQNFRDLIIGLCLLPNPTP